VILRLKCGNNRDPILWNARQALESSSFIPSWVTVQVNHKYLTCQVFVDLEDLFCINMRRFA
jgi:hypothetical protein